MPRHSRQGRTLKAILVWELNHDVTDTEIAMALGIKSAATFSRRKDADDFPTFEELEQIGDHFGIPPRDLQVEFGFLDHDELRDPPHPLGALTNTKEARATTRKRAQKVHELPIRHDAPPLS